MAEKRTSGLRLDDDERELIREAAALRGDFTTWVYARGGVARRTCSTGPRASVHCRMLE